MPRKQKAVGVGALTVLPPYRNRLERSVGDQLTAAGIEHDYEGGWLKYLVPAREAKYLADFRVGDIVLESKGYWGRSAKDRQKFLRIRESHPTLDIRFVFSDAKKKIYKGSPTTYADWCDAHGFKWSTKGQLPTEWIKELKHASGQK